MEELIKISNQRAAIRLHTDILELRAYLLKHKLSAVFADCYLVHGEKKELIRNAFDYNHSPGYKIALDKYLSIYEKEEAESLVKTVTELQNKLKLLLTPPTPMQEPEEEEHIHPQSDENDDLPF
jgi:hypothetical protein